MKEKRKFFIMAIIGLILLVLLFFFSMGTSIFSGNSVKDITYTIKDLEEFTTCLNEENVKLYGVGDGSSLGYQSEIFGKYFSELNYIDCHNESEKCSGVFVYPTWEVKGRPIHGTVLSLDVLSTLSGCKL